MLVDHERVLLGLKRHLATKPHHGQRELAVVIAQLEVECQIEEGLPERALRLYGQELFEVVTGERTPPSLRGCVPAADGDQARASRGDSIPQSEEDSNARSNRSPRAAARRHTPPHGLRAAGAAASRV